MTSTRPGDVLAGRYRLVDLLSESGGGRFWRAHDLVLERPVALHVLPESDPRAEPLLEAAGASAQVLDSRILRVLDADHRDGLCYVVNEWGTGVSLDILVRQSGPLGPRRSAWLTADVAGAVARAHAAGVAHGRLNPENVLIDRYGAIRLIGLCVDAALHGVPERDPETDRADLAGLLYCSLTATWPGPSTSAVDPAPTAHGEVLAPRRVRAGVPRPLDQLWRDLAGAPAERSRRHAHSAAPDLGTAAGIHEQLIGFLGDTTGLPEALAASIPPVNELGTVRLPALADPVPRDFADPTAQPLPEPATELLDVGAPEVEPVPEHDPVTEPLLPPVRETPPPSVPGPGSGSDPERADPVTEPTPAAPSRTDAELSGDRANDPVTDPVTDDVPIPGVADLPTEAGMPVFGESGDVEWLRARSTKPPPPPPFEEPPERPLFAPDPPGGRPSRRPRPDVPRPVSAPPPPPPPGDANGYWPWNADTGGFGPPTGEFPAEEQVPGRSWLRLAMVISAGLLLLVAIVVAFNLGRGRTPLGAEPDPTPTPSATPSATPTARPLTGLTATDFDPFGDPEEENREEVSNVLDGDPASAWSTSTYDQQFGPGGLKPGVGVVIDAGRSASVVSVELTLVGEPTTVRLFVSDEPPAEAPTGDPVTQVEATGTSATLEPDTPVTGRYLLLWVTSLPAVSGGYRAELAEVVVHGE